MFLPQVAAQQNKLVVKKAEGKQGLTFSQIILFSICRLLYHLIKTLKQKVAQYIFINKLQLGYSASAIVGSGHKGRSTTSSSSPTLPTYHRLSLSQGRMQTAFICPMSLALHGLQAISGTCLNTRNLHFRPFSSLCTILLMFTMLCCAVLFIIGVPPHSISSSSCAFQTRQNLTNFLTLVLSGQSQTV